MRRQQISGKMQMAAAAKCGGSKCSSKCNGAVQCAMLVQCNAAMQCAAAACNNNGGNSKCCK